jgi:hypothetical protein
VGSRRAAPLDWESPGYEYVPSTEPARYFETRNTSVYRHSPIKMWPPPASMCSCSERLHNILKPPLSNGAAYRHRVTGRLDEYGLVYMLQPEIPSYKDAEGVIIMVSFHRASLASPAEDTASIAHVSQTERSCDPSYWQWQGKPRNCRENKCV